MPILNPLYSAGLLNSARKPMPTCPKALSYLEIGDLLLDATVLFD